MEIKYDNLSDEEIVSLVHNGNLIAEEYLISKYKNVVKIKTRAYFIVGADKEDLIQEGMIGLFKAIRDYDKDKNVVFYAFAELCITRQIITAIKSATRQKHIPLNSYISLSKQVFESTENTYMDYLIDNTLLNPEELFIGQEDKNIIEAYIKDSLSTMENQVLKLYLDGKSYSQIGKMLNKDEKAIDNAIQRVRKKIEKLIRLDKKISS